jgi:hypothetical protein
MEGNGGGACQPLDELALCPLKALWLSTLTAGAKRA